MSTNKHAAFRYRVLNQCFSNRGRRKWSIEALIIEVSKYLQEEFGSDIVVSKRTIQGDISLMRSPQPRGYNAPIVCKSGLYFYSDTEFKMENPPLRQVDMSLLREAIALIRQLPGMRHLHFLDLMMQGLGEEGSSHGLPSSHIQFEVNSLVKGLEWIAPIYQAIIKKQVLKIRYQPFLAQGVECNLHPYLLKEWRHRWYIFGMVHEESIVNPSTELNPMINLEHMGFVQRKDRIWNLALDRIVFCEPIEDMAYESSSHFDPATWFDDIVGVTKLEDTEPINIEIEVSPIASYYIETRPLHHSQKLLCRNDERSIFHFRLIPNHEILNELLVFGKYVKVLSPDSFRTMMDERLGVHSLSAIS